MSGMFRPQTRRKRIGVFLLAAVITLGVALVRLLSPGGASVEDQLEGSYVIFSSNRAWVVQWGDCVQLSWETGGIQAIYHDGMPTVGVGEAAFCPTDQLRTSVLDVLFPDGTRREYEMTIRTLATAPEMVLLFSVTGALVMAAAYTALAPRLREPARATAKALRPAWKMTRLVLINLAIIAVLLEVGLRFYFYNFGTSQQRGMYVYSAEEIWQDSQASRLPFLNYGLVAGAANRLGYNDPDEILIPKPAEVYRIVALGGSTTYGLLVEPQQAYPAQLEHILREDYGYTWVEVINAGVIGYDSWNSVVNLAFRVLEVEPDMIIIYHATNDIHPREQLLPDCYQGINAHRGLNAEASVLQLEAQQTSPSTLHRFLFINMGWMQNPVELSSGFEPTIPCYYDSLVSDMPTGERLDANPPTYFERNLRTMIHIAEGYELEVMLSTWAYDAAIAAPYGEEHWRRGIAQHNAIVTRLAEEYGTLYYDLAASGIAESSAYWLGDYTHQSVAGHRFQAELFAAYLAGSGVLPRLED